MIDDRWGRARRFEALNGFWIISGSLLAVLEPWGHWTYQNPRLAVSSSPACGSRWGVAEGMLLGSERSRNSFFISAVLVKAWATMWQLWSISHLPWIWHPRTVTVTWWKPHTESCASCVATWTSSSLASAWQLSGFARSAANAFKRKWHSEARAKMVRPRNVSIISAAQGLGSTMVKAP